MCVLLKSSKKHSCALANGLISGDVRPRSLLPGRLPVRVAPRPAPAAGPCPPLEGQPGMAVAGMVRGAEVFLLYITGMQLAM